MNTTEVASVGVAAEVMDESARMFHLRHEFISLAEQRRRLFIGLAAIAKVFGN